MKFRVVRNDTYTTEYVIEAKTKEEACRNVEDKHQVDYGKTDGNIKAYKIVK